MDLVIIDYGAGNVRSVQFALERLGYQAICSNDPDRIVRADKLIFPGVGEANSAMEELRKYELDLCIPQLNQPVLGICLGMQLLCQSSEENDTSCLSVFPLEVKRFDDQHKVPQIGWNRIGSFDSPLFTGLEEGSYVYFVHSYYVPSNAHSIAQTDYGLDYCSAMAKDNFFACQFHPEKSGATGETILKNFLKRI